MFKRTHQKKSRLWALILLVAFVLSACNTITEEMALFRRKIGRVDLITQQADLFDAETSITQLVSIEQRTNTYNFGGDTTIAYDTTFLTVPATVVYGFDPEGKLAKIDYYFNFSTENAEAEVTNIYDECIKFFSYPDQGYTRGIYNNINENPSVLWAKNNAQITLDFWLDDDLSAHAHMRYSKSEWSGTSLAVFKLPFSPHALGDGILSVVSNETKKNSERTSSVVQYAFIPQGQDHTVLAVDYVFKGDKLKAIEMTLTANVESARQMRVLTENTILFMDEAFIGAFRQDFGSNQAYDVLWTGEATTIGLASAKDSGNRQMTATVTFLPYLN